MTPAGLDAGRHESVQRGSHGHLCVGCTAGGRVDSFSRLIVALVLALASCWASASGSVPGTQSGTTQYYVSGYTPGSLKYSQIDSANYVIAIFNAGAPTCSDGSTVSYFFQSFNGTFGVNIGGSGCPGGSPSSSYLSMGTQAAPSVLICPANSTASGTSCTCTDPNVPNVAGTACGLPPDKCAATLAQPLSGEVSAAVAGQIIPTKVCSGGCGYIPTGAVAAPAGGGMGSGFWTKLAGQYTFRGNGADWIGDGSSCTGAPVGSNGDPATPPTPDPTPPPPGMCRGTVNGAVVTVPCDGTSSTSGSSGSGSGGTGPVGSASSPAGTVPGTSSSGTDTSCANGTCSTTTTVKTNKADGTTTTATSVATTGQDTFCKTNPGDPNCAASKSAFGGSCAAATCSGDAVQCQIAKEQARRNCATLDAAAATDPAVIAAAAGIQPADHPYSLRTTVALPGSGGFDQTDILSGGCPADLSVSITAGRSVVIPFSKLCDPAVILGRVLVGITALSCIGIVFVRRS